MVIDSDSFIDPYSGNILQKGDDGSLFWRDKDVFHLYKNYDGVYDFVLQGTEIWAEREYYDKQYSGGDAYELTENFMRDLWYADTYPWRKTLLESLGEIRGKKILLVGNGNSFKELYLLTMGASLVFTDLSLEAVKHIRKEFAVSMLYETYCDKIEFHTVDALNLPFRNEEFDIIYGSAFVHHLDDIDKFFSEVYRCLRKDGMCRFIDEAYSPLWSLLKQTILYPFKVYSQWRQPRSPADIKAERLGGYTFEGMAQVKERYGFRDMLFIREWFLLRIVSRHYGKFFNYRTKDMQRARKLFSAMKWIDEKLSDTKWMQQNKLMLVWGFNK